MAQLTGVFFHTSEKVVDSIPSPGAYERQAIDISIFLPLKINENISSDEN